MVKQWLLSLRLLLQLLIVWLVSLRRVTFSLLGSQVCLGIASLQNGSLSSRERKLNLKCYA
jgi:hypothetical protein